MTDFRDRQRQHFDDQREAYRELYGAESPFHSAMTGAFLAFAGIRGGERVLDLGCGFGRTTLPLLRAGCRVTGLDLSAPTLEALTRRVAELGLRDGFTPCGAPAEELPLGSAFDAVIGRGILHHLEDPAAVVARARQALRPGGFAAFQDPNPLQPAWLPFVALHPAMRLRLERHVWRHTPAFARGLLAGAGFDAVDTRFLGLVPPPLWRLPGAGALENSLQRVPVLRTLGLYLCVRGVRP